MKIIISGDLVEFKYYFFVLDGVVHYGYVDYAEYVTPDEYCINESVRFMVKDSRSTLSVREVCVVWDAQLIYLLD